MRVDAEAMSTVVEHHETGAKIAGVCLQCQRCDHEVKVAGEGPGSYRFGLAKMRDECPKGERNFYVCEDEPEC